MSVQKMDYNRVSCDEPGCPTQINIAILHTEHMRETLHANQWWMDTSGEIVHDALSGQDFIGYKTLCPKHRENR